MSAIDEARALLSTVGAPLYRSILRSAIETGDLGDLEGAIRSARRVAAREREEAAQTEAQRVAIVTRAAAGRTLADIDAEMAILRREQDADYRRWEKRRPDERTARKAHLSNRLDGRARRMAMLSEMASTLQLDPV